MASGNGQCLGKKKKGYAGGRTLDAKYSRAFVDVTPCSFRPSSFLLAIVVLIRAIDVFFSFLQVTPSKAKGRFFSLAPSLLAMLSRGRPKVRRPRKETKPPHDTRPLISKRRLGFRSQGWRCGESGGPIGIALRETLKKMSTVIQTCADPSRTKPYTMPACFCMCKERKAPFFLWKESLFFFRRTPRFGFPPL